MKLAALAVIASLALAGCSAGNQSADTTPSATSAPSASATVAPAISPASPSAAETKKVDPGQAWADEKITEYLNANGAASFNGFFEGSPDREIQAWSSPSEGELAIEISGANWKVEDVESLSLRILGFIQWDAKKLDSIKVSAPDSGVSSECYASEKRGNQPTECA